MNQYIDPELENITINKSGPPPEEDVEDGIYVLILQSIEAVAIQSLRDPNPDLIKKNWRWTFGLDYENDDREVQGLTTKATGPNSKANAWISAILGRQVAEGENLSLRDLIGRRVQGEIEHNARDWPRVKTLMAMPRQARPSANVMAAPDNVTPAPRFHPTPASTQPGSPNPVAGSIGIQPGAAGPGALTMPGSYDPGEAATLGADEVDDLPF